MDFSKNARELEIDEADYVSLLEVFEKQTMSDLVALEGALRDTDLAALYAAAHSIKGASGSLGLWEIHEASAEICSCANQGTIEAVAALVDVMRTELKSLFDRLNETRGTSNNG